MLKGHGIKGRRTVIGRWPSLFVLTVIAGGVSAAIVVPAVYAGGAQSVDLGNARSAAQQVQPHGVLGENYRRDGQPLTDMAEGEVNLVNNPSFEADPLPESWPHYTTSVTGWNAGAGSLLNDSSGPFYTSGLGPIPHGAQLYGKQGGGTLSQAIGGLYHGRSFRLVFHVNNRASYPSMDLTATLGSQTLYGPVTISTNPSVFHYVSAGPFQYDSMGDNTLTFHFTNPQGDSTILLDNVQLLSPQSYTVTYQADPAIGGAISGPGNIAQSGSPGDSISVSVTPNPGFLLTNVAASNGNIVPAGGNEYTLSGVTAATIVMAYFEEDSGEGGVEGEIEGAPQEGEEVEPLVIVEQPLGSILYVNMSWAATILVEGGAGAIVYDWKKDGVSLGWPSAMVNILGPLVETDAGVYSCTVSDGVTTLDSNGASLSVYPVPLMGQHDVDRNRDWIIGLSELLRLIQFYNSGGIHCNAGSEDGYAPGAGEQTCEVYGADYNPQDWSIGLEELLRLVQFFTSACYHPDAGTDDGYGPGAGPA
ncbi:MAG TPA: hypothetical protein PLI09_18545 [Candidatus Hydrogenedentes bacterium]|nr:hypothetical protein [Candidatus Hydrogenedentota bacterium]